MNVFRKLIISVFIFSTLAPGQEYTLEQCVDIALENKETVKTGIFNTELSRLNKNKSYSGILPQIRVSESWSENRSFGPDMTFDPSTFQIISGGNMVSTSSTWVTGLNVTQNIYDGGAWWNNIALGKNNFEVSRQLERQTRINVIRNVYHAFYQRLKSQQLLTVAEWNLDLAKQQVDLVTKQFELGSVKKTDLLKTEVRQGQVMVDYLTKKSALENARRDLKNAMGILKDGGDFTIIEPEVTIVQPPSVEEAKAKMKGKNPGLIAKRGQIRSSDLQYKITKGLRLPSLSASFGYISNADGVGEVITSHDDNWSTRTSVSLSIPLFTGRDLSTRVQQARINKRIVEEEYSEQESTLLLQLHSIITALENYADIIPINEEVLISAEEDQRLVQERYSLGAATILELLDAQVSVIQARSSLISLQYDMKIQEATLFALLGTLDN